MQISGLAFIIEASSDVISIAYNDYKHKFNEMLFRLCSSIFEIKIAVLCI